MEDKQLQERAILRRQAAEEVKNDLFGKPTPGGESMMLHTRQCPECQVGQAGPVPGKEGVWQCAVCGATYQASKGSPAQQLPYDAKFYGGGPFLSWPSKTPHRNTASVKKGLTRRADFRGSVSQFATDVRDAISGVATAEVKTKIGEILKSTVLDGDLYGAINSAYEVNEVPVEEVEVSSEEV